MHTPLLVVIVAALSILGSCSPSVERLEAILVRSDDRGAGGAPEKPTRYLQVEVDNPELGLPCRVVDRPDPETRNVLWRAEFEAGFCQRKALESRAILESQGWACRPLNAQEQKADRYLRVRSEQTDRHVAAVWRCLGGLAPSVEVRALQPFVPLARPSDLQAPRNPTLPKRRSEVSNADTILIGTVEDDLKAIGQDVIDEETKVETALGDLNGDGSDDAVVVLTRGANRNRAHRMLMAYLESDKTYNLVDVMVLTLASHSTDDELGLRIEAGMIHIEACCDDRASPTTIILNDRKLSYVDRGNE